MTHIDAKLTYNVDDGSRPFGYAYRDDFGGERTEVVVKMNNGRGNDNLTLDTTSFELVQQETSLSSEEFFSNPDKIVNAYYDEIAKLVEAKTGAAKAIVMQHQLRGLELNAQQENKRMLTGKVQTYAKSIHNDVSPAEAEETFRRALPSMKTLGHDFSRGRFMYINAWRNISDTNPITNDHLALCDERSLNKTDYLPSDYFLEDRSSVLLRLANRNACRHKWYYFPSMEKNEVLLFKQWDSDPEQNVRQCFHTSFSDPTAPKDAPIRQSIECRVLVFFPDHTPNTCPIVEMPTVGGIAKETDNDVKNAARGILMAIDNATLWPQFAQDWLVEQVGKGSEGMEEAVHLLSVDKHNYFGLQNSTDQFHFEVKELLCAGGIGRRMQVAANEIHKMEGIRPPNVSGNKMWKSAGLLAAGFVLGSISQLNICA